MFDAGTMSNIVFGLIRSRQHRILILGGKGSNFPDDIRGNSQFLFWDSTDPRTKTKDKVPAGVKVVISTKFVGHALLARVRSVLPNGVRFLNFTQGTGKINKLLREVVKRHHGEIVSQVTSIKVPQSESDNHSPSENIAIHNNGSLVAKEDSALSLTPRDFVRAKADFSCRLKVLEVDRLFALSKKQGHKFSRSSIASAFYSLHRKQNEAKEAVVTATKSCPPPLLEKNIPIIPENNTSLENLFLQVEAAKALFDEALIAFYKKAKEVLDIKS
ncbi:MAG: hypothetical protein EXS49_00740 [Candidatus Pacebacteria bacterium]|nr:hypothetical protein [Candidatus Paceibacterota bacterium]